MNIVFIVKTLTHATASKMPAYRADTGNNVAMSESPTNQSQQDSSPDRASAERRESDRDLQQRLSHAATFFDEHAFVHHRCRDELISRLDLLAIEPALIADVGAATGSAAGLLAKRYPRATVVAIEHNAALLGQRAWRRRGFSLRKPRVAPKNAPMSALPLDNDSLDLAFCNLSLARFSEPDEVLREIRRALKPGGVFVFSTLGPGSLRELREAWHDTDAPERVATFTDMHDIGDALGRAGFAEPVLDVDSFQAQYRNSADVWRDLTFSGARNSLPQRAKGLTGKARFEAMTRRLTGNDGMINISIEVVYGQCWGTSQTPRNTGGDIRIDPARIGRR